MPEVYYQFMCRDCWWHWYSEENNPYPVCKCGSDNVAVSEIAETGAGEMSGMAMG